MRRVLAAVTRGPAVSRRSSQAVCQPAWAAPVTSARSESPTWSSSYGRRPLACVLDGREGFPFGLDGPRLGRVEDDSGSAIRCLTGRGVALAVGTSAPRRSRTGWAPLTEQAAPQGQGIAMDLDTVRASYE